MGKVSCFLFFTLISQLAAGQDLDSITTGFNRYKENVLLEKVFIHTDNHLYVAGEYLWLRAYLVDATFHRPIDASSVIYIELLDKNNKAVLQSKIPANEMKGETSLYLPATIETGGYVLRAYTNLMRNFSPDFYFHKPVTIINTFKKPESRAVVNQSRTYEFQLFPEGGNLVEEVDGKVAFKISDPEGRGLSYRGWILTNANDTIVRFKPLRFGMGHFYFTPRKAVAYKLQVMDDRGNINDFNLPEIQSSGYALSVRDSVDRFLNITVTVKSPLTTNAVYLFAHARNIISKAAVHVVEKDKAVFILAKEDLPEGISHFTVFDADFKPQAERLYFKPVTRKLKVAIEHDTAFKTRQKVDFQITAFKGANKPARGNFSVSVICQDNLSEVETHGIHEYFWLISDLKGFIESPEFYFSDHPDVQQAADHLMLTHGWRRFDWNEVLSRRPSVLKFLPEYYGHLISGNVSSASGEKSRNVLTYLSFPDKRFGLYVSRTDTAGEIHFQTQNIYGSRKLIIQTEDPHLHSFKISNPFSTVFSKGIFRDINITRMYEDVIRSRSIAMQVRFIYEADMRRDIEIETDSLPFYGQPDNSYLLDDYTRFPVMEEIMREYVPKVRVRKSNDGVHFLLTDLVNETVFREDPLVLLDGVPVTAEAIMNFDPLKIKRLDVVARRYFLGALTASGIVSYATYEGDLAGFALNPLVFSLDYQGLEQQRIFYSPSYASQEAKSSRVPDYRRLLYWRSHAKTGDDGIFNSSFYTSDLPGKFCIVVEGLTEDGFTGRTVSFFSVSK